MANTWGNLSSGEREVLGNRIELAKPRVRSRFTQIAGAPAYKPLFRFTDMLVEAPPQTIPLIPPHEFDYEPVITARDEMMAEPIDSKVRAGTYIMDALADAAPESAPPTLPAQVDHRPLQSSVKNQLNRGTCVAHASMGLLEAYAHIPEDLSEQYTHYKFNEFEGRSHFYDAGIRTTDAAVYLSNAGGRVCLETEWPYIGDQLTIQNLIQANQYAVPGPAVANQTYGINAYRIITDRGLSGESIKNPAYLESLLALGYNIAFGAWVSWDDTNDDGVLEPVLDSDGEPIGQGGHAMLMVGYDRNAQYFIVKNSWGPAWEHNGYGYFHYNFIRACLKYGFVVDHPVPGS